MLEKIVIWYSIQNGGDGSAYPTWYLTFEDADWDQDNMYEGWGEPCNGSVETFIGSDIYLKAITNSENLIGEMKNVEEGRDRGDYLEV